eukprot:TRINITY_DN11028_c0_g2_i4.p3 TRINITY_DN11028_c0_g2~~TRINITY_DN11028_c0_g2_i4.p3  ORF type:complete len:147 (+),score=29.85 TRINITY_DN11028_c0_g2_i4:1627-2067(+)
METGQVWSTHGETAQRRHGREAEIAQIREDIQSYVEEERIALNDFQRKIQQSWQQANAELEELQALRAEEMKELDWLGQQRSQQWEDLKRQAVAFDSFLDTEPELRDMFLKGQCETAEPIQQQQSVQGVVVKTIASEHEGLALIES